jgi:hypothetical protein
MIRLPILCCNGIGDSFLVLGRVPIGVLGKFGFRFNIFYTTPEHPARQILEPFFRGIRYCDYIKREPSAREKAIFSKMMSLSMRTDKIWGPPFELSLRQKPKCSGKKILLHTHLDGHHGWKGATAKMWPIENWVELCCKLHDEGWEVTILEWDEDAIRELQLECPFLKDGRREGLLDTVKSFEEYDFLFSIDSWSKYVAVWAGFKQVVALSDLRSGYSGFETISPKQVARWWFHGVLNHPKVMVLGLEERRSVYSYTYSQISEMRVEHAIDAIRNVAGNENANE